MKPTPQAHTEPTALPDLEGLLRSPGIGPLVVQRLREVGVSSTLELLRRGVEPTVEAICAQSGQPGWRNRTDALVRALADALRAPASPQVRCAEEAARVPCLRGSLGAAHQTLQREPS